MGEFRADEGPVTDLWAVIAEGQGIVAADIGGKPYPLVTYVPRLADMFAGMLPELAVKAGCKVALIRATGAQIVQEASA